MSKLVLVNERDEEISTASFTDCHRGSGRLHRAFTIFLFDSNNRLLIQERSSNKLLWPLTWESSCSSHPLAKEDYLESAERRLNEELGISCKLSLRNKFQYFARYEDTWSENEVCALLIGKYDGEINPNMYEVESWKYIFLPDLKREISQSLKMYAPWLVHALRYYEDGEPDNKIPA